MDRHSMARIIGKDVLPFITLLWFTTPARSQLCDVDDIEIVDDLDLNKFAGRWFEIFWIPPYFESTTDYWIDYSENYTVVDENTVQATITGRTPGEAECGKFHRTYHVGTTPGRWTYNRKFNNTATIDMNFWILATDYDNYALSYGCTLRNEDGSCKYPDAWIWSRTMSLRIQDNQTIAQELERVCLSVSDFLYTPQEEDCETSNTNTGAAFVDVSVRLYVQTLVVTLAAVAILTIRSI